MKTGPLLTIISVTKDDAAGLRRTVDRAAGLRAAGVEHVVIDGSAEPVTGLPAEVVVIRREAHGIADAFNAGLEGARGEWVWFLNGGDVVDPNLRSEALLELLKGSSVDALIGVITYEGEAVARSHPPANRRWPAFLPWVPHPGSLLRRKLFARHGGYDTRYRIVMDYEWNLRVLCRADVRVEVVPLPLAVFASGGISQRVEFRARLVSERDDVVRRYQRLGWRTWPRGGLIWLKIWGRALLAKRLEA